MGNEQTFERRPSDFCDPSTAASIRLMDKKIRSQLRGNVVYQMKIVIRGERGTGKTSLFQRLQGLPVDGEYRKSKQIAIDTINWKVSTLDDQIRMEVWDIVDYAVVENEEIEEEINDTSSSSSMNSKSETKASEQEKEDTKEKTKPITKEDIEKCNLPPDAQNTNIYHNTQSIIFVLDITKWNTLEYVRKQLDQVPVTIPTVILGNFRDFGQQQRKIFKEDIEELMYGSEKYKVLQRPREIHYFETSMLNCYGLNTLYKYLGIPYFNFKLHILKQQMTLVENDLECLRSQIQVDITESKYYDYVQMIKDNNYNIYTGKSVIRTEDLKVDKHTRRNSSENKEIEEEDALKEIEKNVETKDSAIENEIQSNTTESNINTAKEVKEELTRILQENMKLVNGRNNQNSETIDAEDNDDLPTRSEAVVPPLLVVHRQHEEKPENGIEEPQKEKTTEKRIEYPDKRIKTELLEDFQVDSAANTLNNFFSSSDEENDDDKDVIVKPVRDTNVNQRKSGFLYSDSDSELDT